MNLLLSFIGTGVLSDITLGQSEDELKTKVGDPTDVMSLSDELILWAYGYGLELYIENGKLSKISIKYNFTLEKFELPAYFDVSDHGSFDGLKSIDKLIDLLKEEDIDWGISKDLSDDSTICITCDDGANIYYSLEDHHILSLQSVPPLY